ncbi:MAG: bifunctional riboflavin kinase/FAD synthetase [Mariprofundales bacterium]|nr:bifunctional riboflavin kinase/FAD synthetase [Mariprofundales bacterium]
MNILRHWQGSYPELHGGAITIGNFDGVHMGHRQVLEELRGHALAAQGKRGDGAAIVVTFDPHPRKVLFPQEAPRRLCHLHERLERIDRCGIDATFLLHFDHQLAALEPEVFIRQLHNKFAFRHMHVGYDFAFGKGRSGHIASLRQMGDAMGFTVSEAAAFEMHGAIVSSSRIRSAIEAADLELAARLLGRPFSISGHVGFGDQRGRQLGFPTANLDLRDLVHPPAGIYAVRAHSRKQSWNGVAYLGFRPTFAGRTLVLETHLFDDQPDMYKKRLQVDFIQRVREDRAYNNAEGLARQIERDCADARAILDTG